MKKRILAFLLAIVMLATTVLTSCDFFNTETPHEHTYDSEWSYDTNKHWHAATCEHSDEKIDEAEHIDGDLLDGKCEVCNAQFYLPAHEHADEDSDKKCDVYGEDLYWVSFADGETVISSVLAAAGDYVDIPDDIVPESGNRYEFDGWVGVSDAEMAEGKVEVFYSDATYYANWYEPFGSKNVFEISEVRDVHNITADGVMDPEYADATPIVIAKDGFATTATAYVLWSEEYFYIFVDVKDASANNSDFVELRLDLLHSEKYATSGWDGTWNTGEQYRLGASVEGGWKLKSGAGATEKYFEYWSNLTNERNSAFGRSVRNSEGYTVEWVIKVEDNGFADIEALGTNLYPHLEQQIGIGILVNDEGKGWVGTDNFDGYNGGPKKLSNAVLVDNETVKNHVHTFEEDWSFDDDNHWHKSNCWHKGEVSDLGAHIDVDIKDGKCDVCGGLLEIPEHTHVDANGDGKCDEYNETVYKVEFKNGDTVISSACVTNGAKVDIPATEGLVVPERYHFNGWSGVTAEELAEGKVIATTDRVISVILKEQFGSDLVVELVELRDSTTINCDGVKDEAYNDAKPIQIARDGKETNATAYVLWSETHFYIFVEVNDTSYNAGDAVQIRMDLLHTDEFATNAYNGSWDKDGEYRLDAAVMGGWRAKRDSGRDGDFAYWDYWTCLNRERNSVSVTTKATDNGYAAEYVIKVEDNGFGTFANKGVNLYPHVGQEIGFGIVVQDWDNYDVNLENYDGYFYGGHRKVTNAVLVENEVAKNHEHTYEEDWSFDDENHWYQSTCWHTDEKKEFGAHVDENLKDGQCDVCGATLDIPEHVHADANGDGKCDVYNETVYRVEFKNGDTVVSSYVGLPGDKFAIPTEHGEAPASSVNKNVFNYWDGVTAEQLAAGEITLGESNLTYSAVWKEGFGTDLVVEIVKLADGATITCDGIKDEAYNAAKVIDIVRDGKATNAKAYILWSETHFYVFIEVNDGSKNNGDNVQMRIDLLHTDEFATPNYNGTWGKDGEYRLDAAAQGGWKVKRGANGRDGNFGDYWSHLNGQRGSAQGCSKSTDTGYTVEFIIKVEDNGFATFTNKGVNLYPHVGQEIGIGIVVQDWDNYDVCMENYNGYFWTGHRKITNAILVEAE